jgi:hypothetical protein
MNTAMTITRQFHTTRQRDGRQHLRPGPAPDTPQGKIPRISRLMALAIHCDELLRTDQITNQSELARYASITPARMTQILTLLNLAPDIQEAILLLPGTTKGRGDVQEKDVRTIAVELDWGRQREMWREMPQSANLTRGQDCGDSTPRESPPADSVAQLESRPAARPAVRAEFPSRDRTPVGWD